MNLYFVQRTDYVDHNQYQSFICAAHDADQARAMKPHESVEDGDDSWSNNIAVTCIGVASDAIFTEPVVVTASLYSRF